MRQDLRRALPVLALLAAVALSPSAASAQATPATSHHADRVSSKVSLGTTPNAVPAASGSPLLYGGGKVLTDPSAYVAYWGAEWNSGFTSGSYTSGQAQAYFNAFLADSGGSAWQGTTTEYCQGVPFHATGCTPGTPITNPSGRLQGSYVDTTAVPARPTDSDIIAAAQRAKANLGSSDPNIVYFVMTPTGKSQTGFGTSFCAWHGNWGSLALAYLPFQPDAGSACGRNSVNANDGFGHGWFDGYSIVGGHEYLEAITDPAPDGGWVDSGGYENGDKCAWSPTVPAKNVSLSGTLFAVQPMWSNATAACVFTAPATQAPTTPSAFVPLPPARILDTRVHLGGNRLGAGNSISVPVAGQGGVPASGALAVVMNVTVVQGTAASFLSVFPSGTLLPNASTLNFTANTQAANLAQVALGPDGKVSLFNSQGSVDVIFDIQGYYSLGAPAGSGLYEPLAGPTRLYDSRNDPAGALQAGEVRVIPTAGHANVPTTGAAAVVVNVTSVNGSAQSFLAVTPDGSNAVSTVNFGPADVRPNRAIVKLGSDGNLRVYNSAGAVHVVVDVAGWFTDAANTAATGLLYTAAPPVRIVDTRPAYQIGNRSTPLGQAPMKVAVAGVAAVPSGAKSAALNVTVANGTAGSFLVVYPGPARPTASDLNFRFGQVVANLVVAGLAGDGSLLVYNDQGTTDILVDVEGWYL